MNKTIKTVLIIFGLLIISGAAFIAFGLYSLEIEDTYGDNQDIFYSSRQGDLVVNHRTKEFGEIRKKWTRFYVVRKSDTLNINDWWDDKDIEIYRPADRELTDESLLYEDLEGLIEKGKMKLIKKLR